MTAPSLTYLDLRWSAALYGRLRQIDAPNLRELAIDGRLLSYFTRASTLLLDSLTLRIVGLDHDSDGQPELRAIDRVKDHQGSLKLEVGSKFTVEMLKFLSDGFLWPGLAQVEIELTEHSVGTLISVIAAREAGASGATEEQYLHTPRDASSRLFSDQPRRMTRSLKAVCAGEAQDILAAASAFQLDAGTRPLCSRVQWKLNAPDCVPDDILERLEGQPNIEVERL